MYSGEDLINDADGGVVVVEIQYRLALFGEWQSHWRKIFVHTPSGFLAGSEVKEKGVLNAGLREFIRLVPRIRSHVGYSFFHSRSRIRFTMDSNSCSCDPETLLFLLV